jgi:protocatechuate 3,4-dioxygenase beta subunit
VAALAGHAQNFPVIHGRVVADDTGDPIRNACVAFDAGLDAPSVLTDAEGRFTLSRAQAAQKRLVALKTGYVTTTIESSDGAEFRLSRSGAITGRVLDDLGEPMPLMNVVAERIRREGDRVTFERVASVETDDLGEYRLFGLAAGEFVVATAPGRLGTQTSSVPIAPDRLVLRNYYGPADAPERARPVHVDAGGEVPGIDFTFALPAFATLPLPALPQVRPGASAIIRGRFLRESGLPVRRGRVYLAPADGQSAPYQANTDDDGRYEFRNLLPGTYQLNAATLGNDRAVYGPHGASGSGSPLTLKSGEVAEGIDMTLRRSAEVGGRVLDEYGDPMQNANVRVERIEFSQRGDRRRLIPVAGITSSRSDDRGRYRIFGLPPGRYLVSAATGEAAAGWPTAPYPDFARTYFPSTPVPSEAETLELVQGERSLTIDITLARSRIARLAGTVYGADGKPLQAVVAMTQSARSGAVATAIPNVRTDESGHFEFTLLPPAEYVVQAVGPRPTIYTEGDFASRFVTIDGVDVVDFLLHLSSGSTIEGRVVYEGGDPPEDSELYVTPVPADPDLASLADNAPARAEIHDDGTFEMSGVSGPRRLQVTRAPAGWALKAVRANGIDVTDSILTFGTPDQSLKGVEVVLTNQVTHLAVRIGDPTVGLRGDVRVMVFPVDQSLRFTGSRYVSVGLPKPDGAFEFMGLPRGDYYVAALTRDVISTLSDGPVIDASSFLEWLAARATRITLTDGERRSTSVRIVER